ncbi:recombinase family protein [Liquorilactobacillus satsumensis]|uniref:Resolvase domain protein n=1 Tax=Loigolactobacillus bifermentans DSM 20003 TaxID=1423726 RepID=A0A0R1GZI9_9LACO|nr:MULTISPECIES: recombinase family protein [Lactobacillaceae]KRK36836.1 Resolvase domain protein [Loigolactobacillus bifermentans DSM 20003]MCP9358443.1 recombinase family protein [Liquorilactobacillus satsumensis]MCP9372397.1 recombinase family protein [Liquorilactobacillus satsumensis]QGG61977.1 helix-turn-helix domain-containing protein [Loigolactobacillus bifermentans]QGG62034.1 helix-turn-helix domain-containing protein [Loigolactobacillus bifermentans]
MIIGYARVSKDDQNLNRQIDQLTAYGAEKIIQEKFTGTRQKRPGITQLLQTIRAHDVVVVESISRLGRNTLDILNLIQLLHQKQIKFVSLKEQMDTETPTGRAMLQMMSVIAELERNLLADRVKEGIAASRKRGVTVGRPRIAQEKLDIAIRMYQSGDYSVKEILATNQISSGTFYREVNRLKLKKLKRKDDPSASHN